MKTNAFLLAAAMTGLMSGAQAALSAADAPTGATSATQVDPNHHACKGQNVCKSHGGCKTDKNACKGHNACKGQGGCRTDGAKADGKDKASCKGAAACGAK